MITIVTLFEQSTCPDFKYNVTAMIFVMKNTRFCCCFCSVTLIEAKTLLLEDCGGTTKCWSIALTHGQAPLADKLTDDGTNDWEMVRWTPTK